MFNPHTKYEVSMITYNEEIKGHFERKFQGKAGSSTNDCWRQKTRAPGLSRGVVCVILRLAILIQYPRVTDRQTHTLAHDAARIKWNRILHNVLQVTTPIAGDRICNDASFTTEFHDERILKVGQHLAKLRATISYSSIFLTHIGRVLTPPCRCLSITLSFYRMVFHKLICVGL